MVRASKTVWLALAVAASFAFAPRAGAESGGTCPVTLTISSSQDGQVASWTDSQGPTYVSLLVGREYTFTVSCSCAGHYKTLDGSSFGECNTGTDPAVSFTHTFGFSDWGLYDLYGYCSAGSCSASFHVVAVREPLRFKLEYSNDPYADAPSPLSVELGATVWFWARKYPSGADWPAQKPVWTVILSIPGGGGGTGSPWLVKTFDTASTSPTIDWAVSAECGNTATVSVVVVDITEFPVLSNRTSVPPEQLFPVKEGEHFEVGGTFDYQLAPGWPPPQKLSYQVWDAAEEDELLRWGAARQFSYTWPSGLPHSGSAYVRFYVDRNGNGEYDSTEAETKTPAFWVLPRRVYDLHVEYSDQLAASVPNIASLIQARFTDAEQRVLRKDSADDWRGCVKFNCASISQFTAGPDRPDPVQTRADAVLHWDDDSDVVLVEALDYPQAATVGYSGIGNWIIGYCHDIIVEWHPTVEKTIAHELGHGAGITGDYGKPGGTPDPGSLGDRNIMWYRQTGTCQELYKEDAHVYD